MEISSLHLQPADTPMLLMETYGSTIDDILVLESLLARFWHYKTSSLIKMFQLPFKHADDKNKAKYDEIKSSIQNVAIPVIVLN